MSNIGLGTAINSSICGLGSVTGYLILSNIVIVQYHCSDYPCFVGCYEGMELEPSCHLFGCGIGGEAALAVNEPVVQSGWQGFQFLSGWSVADGISNTIEQGHMLVFYFSVSLIVVI